MGTQTIVQVKLSNILENTMRGFEKTFGSVKSYPVRRLLLSVMREDLLRILNDAVVASLNYFYENKKRGKMASSLRRGIQVKGQSLSSLSAIIHGVDYTIMHEANVSVKPTGGRYLAIPLPDACHSDGRPIFSKPDVWNRHKKTFILSGNDAYNNVGRNIAVTDINPHFPSEVKYIVYNDTENAKLVFLYKLVPYSIFKQGYTNYRGKPLKKLGLYSRVVAGIQSAMPGWARLVWDLLETIPDFTDLKYYKDITIKEIRQTYVRSYNKKDIPTKAVATAYEDIIDFAHWTAEIIAI